VHDLTRLRATWPFSRVARAHLATLAKSHMTYETWRIHAIQNFYYTPKGALDFRRVTRTPNTVSTAKGKAQEVRPSPRNTKTTWNYRDIRAFEYRSNVMNKRVVNIRASPEGDVLPLVHSPTLFTWPTPQLLEFSIYIQELMRRLLLSGRRYQRIGIARSSAPHEFLNVDRKTPIAEVLAMSAEVMRGRYISSGRCAGQYDDNVVFMTFDAILKSSNVTGSFACGLRISGTWPGPLALWPLAGSRQCGRPRPLDGNRVHLRV